MASFPMLRHQTAHSTAPMTTMPQPVNQPGIALITGATGIQGSHLLDRLAKSPRWSKIYAVSRSSPSINNGAAPLRNADAQQVAV